MAERVFSDRRSAQVVEGQQLFPVVPLSEGNRRSAPHTHSTLTLTHLTTKGDIDVPVATTLPIYFWTITYTPGGAATLYVNDGGTIKTANLGTPS